MRISKFHHNERIELNIKFKSFRILIEKVNKSIESQSFLISLFGDKKGLINVILLSIINTIFLIIIKINTLGSCDNLI